jgi:hypothetical protein
VPRSVVSSTTRDIPQHSLPTGHRVKNRQTYIPALAGAFWRRLCSAGCFDTAHEQSQTAATDHRHDALASPVLPVGCTTQHQGDKQVSWQSLSITPAGESDESIAALLDRLCHENSIGPMPKTQTAPWDHDACGPALFQNAIGVQAVVAGRSRSSGEQVLTHLAWTASRRKSPQHDMKSRTFSQLLEAAAAGTVAQAERSSAIVGGISGDLTKAPSSKFGCLIGENNNCLPTSPSPPQHLRFSMPGSGQMVASAAYASGSAIQPSAAISPFKRPSCVPPAAVAACIKPVFRGVSRGSSQFALANSGRRASLVAVAGMSVLSPHRVSNSGGLAQCEANGPPKSGSRGGGIERAVVGQAVSGTLGGSSPLRRQATMCERPAVGSAKAGICAEQPMGVALSQGPSPFLRRSLWA